MTMSRWEYLPPELFYQLSAYIDEEDLVLTSGVCNQWFSILNGLILPRRYAIILRPCRPIPKITEDMFKIHLVNFKDDLKILSKIPTTVTELYLSMDENFTATDDWIDSLKPIHEKIILIKFKNINFDKDSSLRLLKLLPFNVETLVIDGNDISLRTMSILEAAKELFSCLCFIICDRIKYNCAGRDVNKLYLFSDKVKHVEIYGCGLTEKHYISLLNEKHHLQSVTISEGFNLTFKVLKMLSELDDLKHLEIQNADLITDLEWSLCFNNGFNKLKMLKLTQCKGLSNQTIESITFLKLLKTLEIDILNCEYIDRVFTCFLFIKLDKLTLHSKAIWLDMVIEYLNCLKYPKDLLKLYISGPFNRDYWTYKDKIKKIENICDDLSVKFDYEMQLTRIKSFYLT